ncbi:4-hydroxy-tetrahydrodipicolinate reductase [Winogradskyella sp. DF17]|uniref:4-hydroxy-tetrahydrodipicolinate reductase n=1 Tax=Winogradskyella pelagia TaxID=2819984 RepID=A0ABS3T1N7_9FLAO|nr:4-hydroxy-tetrahydrodipicolinate reductase [Winogradskyella sp. DF17]MBO3116647.1 4-hydroxy-tetrahydrodipicolinate reductase [Winogradskyella sp. DF17]
MNIALLGYGRMGKSIEAIALKRGHSIVLKVNTDKDPLDFSNTDVAIDFSLPNTAVKNIKAALSAHVPVISGTTGWLDNYDDIKAFCKAQNGSFIYASNFSLGVNLFFELNRKLCELMRDFKDYNVTIEEIHHMKKLDAPSGTAISLAQDIIKSTEYSNWTLGEAQPDSIPINAKRIEDVPGTHEVSYNSQIDAISIKHVAHNRKGFALGAVIAAEWIKDKKGIYTMKDVLNIG